ncbi:MAG: hypothetical protein KAJ75_05035, partial [Alphaproteobacteria bacterium]|nr:hypothetical protein [Alphaproteobacteria bacterium]
MKKSFLVFLFAITAFAISPAFADKYNDETAPELEKSEVPSVLKEWVPWVLSDYDEDKLNNPCPFSHSNFHANACVWATALTLEVNEKNGAFTQKWQTYDKAWITLAGSRKHWPQEVTINDKPATVISKNGKPSIYLKDKGNWLIKGTFAWNSTPEMLHIPKETGLVSLNVLGKKVDIPDLDRQGRVWIKRQKQRQVSASDTLHLDVSRHIIDDIPMTVETRIVLHVSGKHREEVLETPLLDEFIPMQLDSPLPARLEKDGSLRIQVRPGKWVITVKARHSSPLSALTFSKTGNGKWADNEIWT